MDPGLSGPRGAARPVHRSSSPQVGTSSQVRAHAEGLEPQLEPVDHTIAPLEHAALGSIHHRNVEATAAGASDWSCSTVHADAAPLPAPLPAALDAVQDRRSPAVVIQRRHQVAQLSRRREITLTGPRLSRTF